jgi:hypothetical protein
LRHIAVSLGITGRSASGIVTGLTAARYVVKHKRRPPQPLPDPGAPPAANLPAKNLPSAKSWPSHRVTAPGSS